LVGVGISEYEGKKNRYSSPVREHAAASYASPARSE
jgi:hypothetical protein